MTDRDREVRFRALDVAVFAERELTATAVAYLADGSEERRRVVERHIGGWGGMRAATGIIRSALVERSALATEVDSLVADVKDLMDLRHLLAHGSSDLWEANEPKVRDGQAGREVVVRTKTGKDEVRWVDFA